MEADPPPFPPRDYIDGLRAAALEESEDQDGKLQSLVNEPPLSPPCQDKPASLAAAQELERKSAGDTPPPLPAATP